MRCGVFVWAAGLAGVTGILSLAAVPVASQAPTAARTTAAAEVFLTPWGEPDVQGIWSLAGGVPLERPEEYAGQAFLTDEEMAALDRQKIQDAGRNVREGPGSEDDVESAYNAVFNSVLRTGRRTSLIVDPADGKMPPLTAEAQKRLSQPSFTGRGDDAPEDRSPAERCVGANMPDFGAGTGGFGDGTVRIVQSPGYVAIYFEHTHAGGVTRVIPVDGSPHAESNFRPLMGDSRGRWEGQTLVVDTINFGPRADLQTMGQRTLGLRGLLENLHIVERYRRVDANTLEREITIDEPSTWTRPWTVIVDLGKNDEKRNLIFESACHEGNLGMTGILSGGRAEDRAAEAAR